MRKQASLVVAAVVIAACTTVRTVPLAELVSEQERFAGDTVQTSGTVRAFVDPDGSRYYVLEDGADNRVQLLPATAVAPYDGVAVAVIGIFDVRTGLGRTLEVQSVDPPRPSSSSAQWPSSSSSVASMASGGSSPGISRTTTPSAPTK